MQRANVSNIAREPNNHLWLPYPARTSSDWRRYNPPINFKTRIALRSCRKKILKANAGPCRSATDLISAAPNARPLAQNDLPLIACVRNGAPYIKLFLHHYRNIGITRFIILDNGSSDDTTELLQAQDDVDLHQSPLNFSRTQDLWRDALIDLYGRHRWYVVVDIDELLVYSNCEHQTLHPFLELLESRRIKRALGPMIDVYPDGPLKRWVLSEMDDANNLDPLFDADGYSARLKKTGVRISGGPRMRIFNSLVPLEKYPVIWADDKTSYRQGNIHAPTPARRNFGPPRCALLHLKFSYESVEQFCRIAAQDDFHHRAQNCVFRRT